jgi:hypothetical protein
MDNKPSNDWIICLGHGIEHKFDARSHSEATNSGFPNLTDPEMPRPRQTGSVPDFSRRHHCHIDSSDGSKEAKGAIQHHKIQFHERRVV